MWPLYESLNAVGLPYMRQSLVIGELPLEMRTDALMCAAKGLADFVNLPIRHPPSMGTPGHVWLGITRNQAKQKPKQYADAMLLTGYDMPLWMCCLDRCSSAELADRLRDRAAAVLN